MNKMKLIYCDKKLSNNGGCSKLACYTATVKSQNGNESKVHRCDEHKFSGTAKKSVIKDSLIQLNQQEELSRVNQFLNSLIGQQVVSKFHYTKSVIIGKYLKDNGAIMCQTSNGKWVLVYYHQILIPNKEQEVQVSDTTKMSEE